MRLATPLLALLVLGGCEERKPLVDRFLDEQSAAPAGSASAPAASARAAASASAPASASASAAASASAGAPKMPPRPLPLGSSGPVRHTDPPEQQMMAITYTFAMAAPHPTDPLVDKEAVEAILGKVRKVVRPEPGTTAEQTVQLKGAGRVIEVLMEKGCTARTPKSLLVSRAGVSIDQAFRAGLLVIKCNDEKWACHQSVREPKDVLCHTAPRHGRKPGR
ncbi:MAG: hypothetical protein HY744_27710 [Deltaproteobacteria bacterium]|nr:hypothetical protein [Deltaproteobacteria bacterium]